MGLGGLSSCRSHTASQILIHKFVLKAQRTKALDFSPRRTIEIRTCPKGTPENAGEPRYFDYSKRRPSLGLKSKAIITTEPNEQMSAIHNRQPQRLGHREAERLLSGTIDENILGPFNDPLMITPCPSPLRQTDDQDVQQELF